MRMSRRTTHAVVSPTRAIIFIVVSLVLATSPSHAAQSKNERPSPTTAKLDIVVVSPVTPKTGDNA